MKCYINEVGERHNVMLFTLFYNWNKGCHLVMARKKIGAFITQGLGGIFDFGRVRRKIVQLSVARSIPGGGPIERQTKGLNSIENEIMPCSADSQTFACLG